MIKEFIEFNKEQFEEMVQAFKLLYEYPKLILILLTVTGIIPSLVIGLLFRIFGL